MTDKHTPGPWTLSRAKVAADGGFDFGIGAIVNGRGRCIAETFEVVAEDVRVNAHANGRLIVAAPDLYAACKIAAAAEVFWVDGIIDLDALDAVIDAAKAAIAKVDGTLTGETNAKD